MNLERVSSEPISRFEDLAQCVGRRVSVNEVFMNTGTGEFVVDSHLERVSGVLECIGGFYGITPEGGRGVVLIQNNNRMFEAREPMLED